MRDFAHFEGVALNNRFSYIMGLRNKSNQDGGNTWTQTLFPTIDNGSFTSLINTFFHSSKCFMLWNKYDHVISLWCRDLSFFKLLQIAPLLL